jgi:hypothetical protein
MPVEKCQIDNQDGYRWGPQGKCYTGPDAESKAAEQGKAINAAGGMAQALSIVKLANDRVGFDYDDTLTTNNVQKIVNRLITAGGTTVYIVSARQSEIGMMSLANKLGIPNHRIFATGSNKAKVAKIKELGLNKFYDNNPDVIKELLGVGILVR